MRRRWLSPAARALPQLVWVEGDLVRTTDGKWVTEAPTRCPNGHTLGPNQVLVGHVACLGHGGGHTIWHCRTCGPVVHGAAAGHTARRSKACDSADLDPPKLTGNRSAVMGSERPRLNPPHQASLESRRPPAGTGLAPPSTGRRSTLLRSPMLSGSATTQLGMSPANHTYPQHV